MRAGPYRKLKICSLLAILALITLPPITTEAGWSVQKFKVFAGAPYKRADGLVGAVGFDWAEAEDWFPDLDRAEVEKALNEAAAWYSNEGFPEPILEPIIQTDSGPAYQVYVCTEAWSGSLWASELWQEALSLITDPQSYVAHWSTCGSSYGSDSSEWAAYSGPCAVSVGSRPVLFINADGPSFKDGKLTALGYQTLAHEMFHAIEANTVMGRSPDPCERGKWIGEGMADAISMDLFAPGKPWHALPQPTNDDEWINKSWGIRPYHRSLTVDTQGYTTSSFWRFLAGLNGGYDYLLSSIDGSPGVFDFEIEKSGDWKSEVSWLDAGLHARFDKRLSQLLGLFMNDLSMRIAPQSWTSGDAQKDWPRSVKALLGGCQEIILSARKPSEVFFQVIKPMAGACAWLTVNVPHATGTISLQTESADVSVFKDVLIGLPIGDTILTPAINAGISHWDPSRFVGIWTNFTVPTGSPTLLTFTNAADDPDKTNKRDVLFEISIPSSTSSLRGPAPAGPGKAAKPALSPSYKKYTQTLDLKTAATIAMITEQKNLDKEVLSPHAALSTSVAMRPNQLPCQDPYKYAPCGPYTSISMELMPGTWGNLGQSAGRGGTASQVLSSMMSQALSNPLDSTEVAEGLRSKIESIDAANVSISMPFFDYGFSGSIDNASISTRVGGKHMAAFGPPDSNGNTPLTGSVTIEEYTPLGLKGSYSAALAYFEEARSPDQDPIYKRGPMLSGTFNQVAPWLSDGRVNRIQLQNVDEMAEDISTSLGIPASTMRALQEQSANPGGSGPGDPGGGSGSGGTVLGGCNCSCDHRDEVDELCEFFCEEEFANCPD